MDRRHSTGTALLAAALGVGGVVIGAHGFVESLRHLFSSWPNFRLGFSALLVRGLPLYPDPHTGPVVGDIYGPVAALFYTPTLLGPSITANVWLAEAWSAAAVGGLVVAACALRSRGLGLGRLEGVAVGLLACAVMLSLPGLSHCLVQVHADAPALFFSALSCLVWRGAERWSLWRSACSALLLCLACLSKQPALFVLLGHGLVLGLRFGVMRGALHCAVTALLLPCLFFGLCFAIGAEPAQVWFYLVTIPGKHELMWADTPFVYSRLVSVGIPALALLGVLAATWPASDRVFKQPSSTHLDWLLLAATGVLVTPMSFLAVIKAGGYLNNLHAHYYLLFAACLAALDKLADLPLGRDARRSALAVALLMSLLMLPNDLSADAGRIKRWWSEVPHNPHQRAYLYLRDHDDAYFPWHTLSVAKARGRVYTSFDGLRTLARSGVHIDPRRVPGSLPAEPRYIVFPKEGRGIHGTLGRTKRIYPRARRLKHAPKGLEGFVVFRRPD